VHSDYPKSHSGRSSLPALGGKNLCPYLMQFPFVIPAKVGIHTIFKDNAVNIDAGILIIATIIIFTAGIYAFEKMKI
jgi:hypothetical protein